jgi:hypothetical protein
MSGSSGRLTKNSVSVEIKRPSGKSAARTWFLGAYEPWIGHNDPALQTSIAVNGSKQDAACGEIQRSLQCRGFRILSLFDETESTGRRNLRLRTLRQAKPIL